MPPRPWQQRIRDILDAAQTIRGYTAGLSFEDFSRTRMIVEAVGYNFLIIGEAAGHIPENVTQRHAAVPWREMREMRNVIAHGYFAVSTKIVWDTVQSDLPSLVTALEALLAAEAEAP